MKLYHATPAENAESIIEAGIFPTDCGTKAHGAGDSLQGRGLIGVYGFIDMESAELFASDNGNEFAIFSFEWDGEIIADPEYDDETSVFVETDEPIPATFERNQ